MKALTIILSVIIVLTGGIFWYVSSRPDYTNGLHVVELLDGHYYYNNGNGWQYAETNLEVTSSVGVLDCPLVLYIGTCLRDYTDYVDPIMSSKEQARYLRGVVHPSLVEYYTIFHLK